MESKNLRSENFANYNLNLHTLCQFGYNRQKWLVGYDVNH